MPVQSHKPGIKTRRLLWTVSHPLRLIGGLSCMHYALRQFRAQSYPQVPESATRRDYILFAQANENFSFGFTDTQMEMHCRVLLVVEFHSQREKSAVLNIWHQTNSRGHGSCTLVDETQHAPKRNGVHNRPHYRASTSQDHTALG